MPDIVDHLLDQLVAFRTETGDPLDATALALGAHLAVRLPDPLVHTPVSYADIAQRLGGKRGGSRSRASKHGTIVRAGRLLVATGLVDRYRAHPITGATSGEGAIYHWKFVLAASRPAAAPGWPDAQRALRVAAGASAGLGAYLGHAAHLFYAADRDGQLCGSRAEIGRIMGLHRDRVLSLLDRLTEAAMGVVARSPLPVEGNFRGTRWRVQLGIPTPAAPTGAPAGSARGANGDVLPLADVPVDWSLGGSASPEQLFAAIATPDSLIKNRLDEGRRAWRRLKEEPENDITLRTWIEKTWKRVADNMPEGQSLSAYEKATLFVIPLDDLVREVGAAAAVQTAIGQLHRYNFDWTSPTARTGWLAYTRKVAKKEIARVRGQKTGPRTNADADAARSPQALIKELRERLAAAHEPVADGAEPDIAKGRELLEEIVVDAARYAPTFGGSVEYTIAKITLAHKIGTSDPHGARPSPWDLDFLPDWEWPAALSPQGDTWERRPGIEVA